MKALVLIFGLFSVIAHADPTTVCLGPKMMWAEAYMRFFSHGETEALLGSFKVDHRMRECDSRDNCKPWQEYTMAGAKTNGLYLIKGSGRKIHVVLNYYGKKIRCGLVESDLTCKDPTSYLVYKGTLNRNCFRVVAHEPQGALDDKGDYSDDDDILFAEY